MNKLSKFFGISMSALIGRSAVIALVILVLPVLFFTLPKNAQIQVIDSNWRDLGADFVAFEPNTTTAQTAARTFDIAELQTFTRNHIAQATQAERQLDCMTSAIYYEARSEPVSGQLAVAQVVLNRTTSKHYPSTVCEVVYQGSKRKTGCQFSFTCDGSLSVLPRSIAWERSRKSAVHAMLGMTDITIGKATHYHTVAISPKWSSSLLKTADVGSHVFYRFPNRREKAMMSKDI
ncbi:hypothetical protein MNBD_ALPHA06-206 [hydrothermal vent metagenome]|uniref:Cell wall hydrolase SleB domain-containing protein n=1 Tax=hydrothermal vent metagenome TaxID=652676 RepID=A0A3B0RL31_9ZZZZ